MLRPFQTETGFFIQRNYKPPTSYFLPPTFYFLPSINFLAFSTILSVLIAIPTAVRPIRV